MGARDDYAIQTTPIAGAGINFSELPGQGTVHKVAGAAALLEDESSSWLTQIRLKPETEDAWQVRVINRRLLKSRSPEIELEFAEPEDEAAWTTAPGFPFHAYMEGEFDEEENPVEENFKILFAGSDVFDPDLASWEPKSAFEWNDPEAPDRWHKITRRPIAKITRPDPARPPVVESKRIPGPLYIVVDLIDLEIAQAFDVL